MANTSRRIKIDLDGRKDALAFESPAALRDWVNKENQSWNWVNGVNTPFKHAVNRARETFQNQLERAANDWHSGGQDVENTKKVAAILQNLFDQTIIVSQNPAGIFIKKLREEEGDEVAASAYAYLTLGSPGMNNFPSPNFFEGVIHGFLFERGIEWTATAHREMLTQLESTYSTNIAEQQRHFEKIEKQNEKIAKSFDEELVTKRDSLHNLHVEQSEAFKALVEKYDTELKQIEETYDQKLALQKPVTYWETKQVFHNRMSKRFGAGAAISAIVLIGLLSFLIYSIFGALKQGDDPRPWQLGVVAAGVFFAIWFLRIILRLFFSHVHLASDSAERRTMILTYLALAREGADVGPEDRKLILQHLFRTASDGLVRDDATPAGIWELITRSK